MFTRKKTMFFQCGIEKSLVYILYVPKKKVIFFQCGIENSLVYIYIHSMSTRKKLCFFNVRFETY